jgi:hypothetical protein
MSFAKRAVDSSFKLLGVDGFLDPAGANKFVKVIPSNGDEFSEFASQQIQSASDVYEIRTEDFVGFGKGSAFSVAGRVVKIIRTEVRDPQRLKTKLFCGEIK